MAALLCPKDQSTLTSIERNGVTIERCPECGGIFLDRGELERLMEAEATYMQGNAPPAAPPYAYDDRANDYRGGEHGGGEHGGYRGGEHGGRRKRRGFLGDLLDFG